MVHMTLAQSGEFCSIAFDMKIRASSGQNHISNSFQAFFQIRKYRGNIKANTCMPVDNFTFLFCSIDKAS